MYSSSLKKLPPLDSKARTGLTSDFVQPKFGITVATDPDPSQCTTIDYFDIESVKLYPCKKITKNTVMEKDYLDESISNFEAKKEIKRVQLELSLPKRNQK